jgi:putative ferrous iron transport protein C
MILSDIKGYLMQHGQASLADIATHFDSSPDAVRGMLEVWQRKGRVRRLMANASCGSGCSKCDMETVEIYQWTGGEEYPPEIGLAIRPGCPGD